MFMHFNLKKLFGALGVVLLLMSPMLAFSDETPAPGTPAPAATAPAPAPAPAAAPKLDSGDTAWMMTSNIWRGTTSRIFSTRDLPRW